MIWTLLLCAAAYGVIIFVCCSFEKYEQCLMDAQIDAARKHRRDRRSYIEIMAERRKETDG